MPPLPKDAIMPHPFKEEHWKQKKFSILFSIINAGILKNHDQEDALANK